MHLLQSILRVFGFNKKPFRYFDLDLEQYSFNELSVILKDFNLNLHVENHTMIAKWESPLYLIHVEYDVDGCFKKLLTKKEKSN